MAQLIGHQIDESSTIQNKIKDLVGDVTALNSQITGIRAPHPEHIENGKNRSKKRVSFVVVLCTILTSGLVLVEVRMLSLKMEALN